MTERTIRTCDLCTLEIVPHTPYVNAGSYGRHYHPDCFKNMSAYEVVESLNLDDIKTMTDDDWQAAVKLTSYIRSLN